MSTVLEYTYDYDDVHPLDDREAVEQYQREKAANPDALVTINDLGCGEHWTVRAYKTDREKEAFLRKKAASIWDRFSASVVRRHGK